MNVSYVIVGNINYSIINFGNVFVYDGLINYLHETPTRTTNFQALFIANKTFMLRF